MRRVLLAIALLSAACHRDAATGTAGAPARVSDDELVAVTRWQLDYMELFNRHWVDLHAVGENDPDSAIRNPKAIEAKVAEVVARQGPVMQALLDRRPLQEDARAELVTEAVGGIFHYGRGPDGQQKLVVARDEVRLDAARRRFSKDAIDDIVAREPLILAALRGELEEPAGVAAGDARVDGFPSPEQLEAYVSGAGAVRLGMTESEVTEALGRAPSRRQDAQSPGASTDVAWDDLQGPQPGAALGRFVDDRLISIEFAPAAPVFPRLDYPTAESVTRADYVRRSVARTLRMADIETVTRVPGYRASWTIMTGFGSPTRVKSRWMWEVDPGDRVLYVEELDGLAHQPVIRDKR